MINLIRVSIIICLSLSSIVLRGQENLNPIDAVNQLFDGMRTSDSIMVKNAFHPEARLLSIAQKKDGTIALPSNKVADFVKMVGTPHEEIYNEQLYEVKIEEDGRLATVWAPYTFYVGKKLSHCGTNAFQLVKGNNGWQIIQIIDTRYRENCEEAPSVLIHTLMDDWHHAAAVADEDVFFGSMTKDGIYLGTDDSERWLRDDMAEWADPYFQKESAWSFTAKDREIYFAEDGLTAWFEERLDTWMGPCRGSGVVKLTSEGWKIAHYNLAILVPNDKIDGFLELIGKEKKK